MLRTILAMAMAAMLMGNVLTDRASDLLRDGKDAEAFELVEQGASMGDAEAVDFLAWFYDSGRHVPQDLASAARLYRQSAAQGVPHAQWRLGVMIDEGSAPGSLEEAVSLFRQSAAQDFTNAWSSLGVMQASGRGTPLDYVAARKSFETAARMGNVHAFNEIGVMFINGEGVAVDPQEAAAWFAIAATHGDKAAQHYLTTGFTDFDIDPDKLAERATEIAREYGLLDDSDRPDPSVT
ncbi:MAG: sel1 repeat family protein [Sphingomonadales bacterium]|nr:sel1 repeat family protein [Sphingomonadales bacterium]MBD3775151.1 sel1 repeat family protein [Paracoccaceae bacterium]